MKEGVFFSEALLDLPDFFQVVLFEPLVGVLFDFRDLDDGPADAAGQDKDHQDGGRDQARCKSGSVMPEQAGDLSVF